MEKFLLYYEKDGNAHALDNDLNDICLNNKLYSYINELCLKNGSNIEGRFKAFTYLTNIKYKPCLVVSHQYDLYLLMTRSIRAKDVILINYLELASFHQINNFETKLNFINGQNIIINVNYRIIKRQNDQMKKYLCLYTRQ